MAAGGLAGSLWGREVAKLITISKIYAFWLNALIFVVESTGVV